MALHHKSIQKRSKPAYLYAVYQVMDLQLIYIGLEIPALQVFLGANAQLLTTKSARGPSFTTKPKTKQPRFKRNELSYIVDN